MIKSEEAKIKQKERDRKYYLEHKDKIKAYRDNWRKNNVEREKQTNKIWAKENKEKLKEYYELPNLLEVQLEAYREFLQMATSPQERKHQGLEEVFEEIFPIENANRSVKIEFISYSLGKSKYNISESRNRALTYAAPLKVKFRLTTPRETKEQDAYFGEIPLMTDTGTFIINGDERVVVSQLQRSPGVSFEEELHPTGKKIFYGRIIPYRGAWLEFKYDLSETIVAYVDRRRSFPATQLLRILGFASCLTPRSLSFWVRRIFERGLVPLVLHQL